MSDTNNPQPEPEPTKSPGSLVLCKLDSGAVVTTTFSNCRDVLHGQVVGKVESDSVTLVACALGDGKTVQTIRTDCTGKLGGTVQEDNG